MSIKKNAIRLLISIFTITFLLSCAEEELEFQNTLPGFEDETGGRLDDDPIGGGGSGGSGGSGGGGSGIPLTGGTALPDRFQYFSRSTANHLNIFSQYVDYDRVDDNDWSNVYGLSTTTGSTGHQITAEQFGNKVYIAYMGRTNGNIYYSSSSNGTLYGTNKRLPNGARTSGYMRLINFKGKLFLYYNGRTNNSRMYYSYTSDGNNWAGNQQITINGSWAYDRIFDVVVENDTLYLITSKGYGLYVMKSTDGITFENVAFTASLFGNTRGNKIHDLSVTKHNNRIVFLFGRGNGFENRYLYVSQTPDIETLISPPQALKVGGSHARTRNRATIASSTGGPGVSQLVVAFEGRYSNRPYFAYSHDGYNWLGNSPISSWTANRTLPGLNKEAGFELIYMK